MKADGDRVATEQVYFARGLPNGFVVALLIGNYLYGADNRGPLLAIEFTTGKVMWKGGDFSSGARYPTRMGFCTFTDSMEMSRWWRLHRMRIGRQDASLLRGNRSTNRLGG